MTRLTPDARREYRTQKRRLAGTFDEPDDDHDADRDDAADDV